MIDEGERAQNTNMLVRSEGALNMISTANDEKKLAKLIDY